MLLRIWRASHLLLVMISAAFLLLIIVSGIILSVEPIQNEVRQFGKGGAKKVPLSILLQKLDAEYETLLEMEVLEHYAVKLSTIDMDEEKDGDFFIDPTTGKKLGDIPPKNKFFQSITNFHRSLFLKTTGRIIVGVCSFLFFLIIITGILLLAKRDGGIQFLFKKTIYTGISQFLHVSISKWTWIPLIILALTGVYLSLIRFEFIPEKEPVLLEESSISTSETAQPITDFEALKGITLGDVKKIEFPFSEDEEDPYSIQLHHNKLLLNQYTGQIIEAYKIPLINRISRLNFVLHTGANSIPWALVLGISTLGSLFLMYFGFVITLKRWRTKLPSKFSAQEAEYVILFGSENGATKSMAVALYKSLIDAAQKVYIDELNKFQAYKKLKSLLILTSTYGEGEAPGNANNFLKRVEEQPPSQSFNFSILGFGSLAYPEFCQFAKDINQALSSLPQAQQQVELQLIHNQSKRQFVEWSKTLSQDQGLKLNLSKYLHVKVPRLQSFYILDRQEIEFNGVNTYLITLKPKRKHKFQSGDLLDFYPEEEPIKRSYSIAKDQKGNILLAIKKHSHGIVSNWLYNAPVNSEIKGKIERNPHFHFPKKKKNILLIANGTGIGPFLGMIQQNQATKVSLYWGDRSRKSYQLYGPIIEQALKSKQLQDFKMVFSRESSSDKYVQDLLKKEGQSIAAHLHDNGVIMICGSITMHTGVTGLLNDITNKYLNQALDFFIEKNQVLSDCY